MLVWSWGKLLQDLEAYDLQSFRNEEISKSKIRNILCAMRSFKNIGEDNSEEWWKSDVCEVSFQHMTDKVNNAMKQKREAGAEDDYSCVFSPLLAQMIRSSLYCAGIIEFLHNAAL